jgi:hypothetical protein
MITEASAYRDLRNHIADVTPSRLGRRPSETSSPERPGRGSRLCSSMPSALLARVRAPKPVRGATWGGTPGRSKEWVEAAEAGRRTSPRGSQELGPRTWRQGRLINRREVSSRRPLPSPGSTAVPPPTSGPLPARSACWWTCTGQHETQYPAFIPNTSAGLLDAFFAVRGGTTPRELAAAWALVARNCQGRGGTARESRAKVGRRAD